MNKIYFTADDVSQMLGVSRGQAYKIIKKLNEELEKKNILWLLVKCQRNIFQRDIMAELWRRCKMAYFKRNPNGKWFVQFRFRDCTGQPVESKKVVLIGKETLRLGWKNTYLRCKLERKSQ